MALTAEDKFDLQQLYSVYCHAVDAMDGERWAECWVEDGEFRPSVGPTAGQLYKGRAALAGFAAARPDNYPQARIWTSNHVFIERDGFVQGTCYGMTVDVSGSRPKVTAHYIYDDEVVSTTAGWRFRKRTPKLDVEMARG